MSCFGHIFPCTVRVGMIIDLPCGCVEKQAPPAIRGSTVARTVEINCCRGREGLGLAWLVCSNEKGQCEPT